MALNLWTTNGKPSSYIPFPNVTQSYPNLDIGQYVFSFYAYSPSNAIFRIGGQNNNLTANGAHPYNITLSQTRTLYTVNVINTSVQSFQILDANNIGDIVIDSVSLTKAPLAKNTINGLDGFLSGKWSISNNAVVSDDVTLHLNTASPWDNSALILPVLPNTTYNFSCFASSNGISLAGILVGWLDSNNVTINSGNDWACNTLSTSVTNISGSLTSPSNAVKVSVMLTSNGSGVFTFNKPMLNLGSIPAPYEPKRGDKMVLPTAKKNFIPSVSNFILESVGSLERENISDTKLRLKTLDGAVKYVDYSFDSLPNKQYTVSVGVNDGNMPVYSYNGSGYTVLATLSGEMKSATFTTPSDCKKIKINCETKTVVGDYFFDQIQLEQGTTATPFAPYAVQVNPKPKRAISAKSGMALNGVTDYYNLPSLTIDSIEIDCLIDSNQPYQTQFFIDTRNTFADGWVHRNSYGIAINSMVLNGNPITLTGASGFPRDTRFKIKIGYNQSFNVNNTHILGEQFGTSTAQTKGTIYKVTCYLNGQIVAQYDLTNPNTITGTTVLTNGNTNLLPSFDSGQWTIHANAKVLGKDVLHLDANSATYQVSQFSLVANGGNYRITCGGFGAIEVWKNGSNILGGSSPYSNNFSCINGDVILIKLYNTGPTAGSFDFINPQLFQLNGNEGTINGSPVLLKKSSARKLFAKR